MSQKLSITIVDDQTGREIVREFDNHPAYLAEFTARRREYEIVDEVTETRLVVRRKAGDLFSQSEALYRR